MPVGKASIKRAADAGTKKKTAKAVKSNVIASTNVEEMESKFITKEAPEKSEAPVQVGQPLPVHLL